jgi:thiamine pyrophosphokinase
MKRVLIIASGELVAEIGPRLRRASVDHVVAVDGGADHCRALGMVPDLIVGDLDSIAPETLAHFTKLGIPFERHPPHKDETDLELALLSAVRHGAEHIILAGVLGGRLDMTVANVLLLTRPQWGHVRVELWEPRRTTWLIRPPGEALHGQPGDTLSLIALQGDAEGLTTAGLAYPLNDETLVFGQARGLSNVFTTPLARIQMRAGALLAIHTLGRA